MHGYEVISLILKDLASMVAPGVKTIGLDRRAEELLGKYGAKSYNRGYKPSWAPRAYPAVICASVNNTIAHGIPGMYELKEGDIISLDLGLVKDGECADAALTVPVGEVSRRKQRLIKYAKEIVYEALELFKPGAETKKIAEFIDYTAGKHGYLVNRRLAGHRISSREMHAKPNIYNTVEETHVWGTLEKGQIYAIEPMLTSGVDRIGVTADGWQFFTADKEPSAFFEHMVEITADGHKVLTTHFERE